MASSTPAAAPTVVPAVSTVSSLAPLMELVRHSLLQFSKKLAETHSFETKDEFWNNTGCQAVLTRVRVGEKCGKKCSKGSAYCSTHAKSHAAKVAPAGGPSGGASASGTNTPAPAGKPALAAKLFFNRSVHGNYTCQGYVIDKISKAIVGKENDEGKIVDLTEDDCRKVKALGLTIATKAVGAAPHDVVSSSSAAPATGSDAAGNTEEDADADSVGDEPYEDDAEDINVQ